MSEAEKAPTPRKPNGRFAAALLRCKTGWVNSGKPRKGEPKKTVTAASTLPLRRADRVRMLATAEPGTERIICEKMKFATRAMDEYSEAGWVIMDQSSSKSFGSGVDISIRFRKS